MQRSLVAIALLLAAAGAHAGIPNEKIASTVSSEVSRQGSARVLVSLADQLDVRASVAHKSGDAKLVSAISALQTQASNKAMAGVR